MGRRTQRRTTKKSRWAFLAGAAAVLAGAAVALLGAATLAHHVRVMIFGRTAVATVVDRIEQPGRRGPIFTPILEFEDETRRVVRVRSSLASRGEGFERGAKVTVVYLPGAPERADVTDGRMRWFAGGSMVLIGALVALLGWAFAGSDA